VGWLRWPSLVLAAGTVILLWQFYKSLPRQSGTLHLRGLGAPVQVTYDERGVPHITAENMADLFRAQGYLTASDRLWSMDALRRLGSGRLAEALGRRYLGWDQHIRTVGLYRAAKASLECYTPDEQALLAAYAEGVNTRIRQGRLPFPFWLLRYRPELWRPEDSILSFRLLQYEWSGSVLAAGVAARLWQTVGEKAAVDLLQRNPDRVVASVLNERPLPPLDDLLEILPNWVGESAPSGSWLVTGERSRSGAPLLHIAPRIRLRIPPPFYTVHLRGPDGLEVIGASIPGVPGVLMGRNATLAWGLTPPAQGPDLVLEERRPGVPDEFRTPKGWRKATIRKEAFRGLGETEVLVTPNGPVLAADEQSAVCLRWAGLRPAADLRPLWALARARTWADAKEALAGTDAPLFGLLLADRNGTTAQVELSPRPILAGDRPGKELHPWPIVPGWLPSYQLTGWAPPLLRAAQVNPAEGFSVAGAPSYPAAQLTELLKEARHLQVPDLHRLHTDPTNLQAQRLLPLFLRTIYRGLGRGPAWEGLTDLEKRCLLLLSEWDRRDTAQAPGPALWHHWYNFLLEAIFRPQMGHLLYQQFRTTPLHTLQADRLIEQVAAGAPSPWLALEGDQGLGRLVIQSYRRAVNLMAARQGPNPDAWRWGKEHGVTLRHSLSLAIGALEPYLRLGPFSLSGGHASVAGAAYRPTRPFAVTAMAPWVMGVDLGEGGSDFIFCLPGQSEHPLSPFYSDQWLDWLQGTLPPLRFRAGERSKLPILQLLP
jgi:penicillin amidase